MAKSGNSTKGTEYFEQYWRYTAALRNWFVVYGIGGCVVLIKERTGVFKGVCKETMADILFWFIAGVVAQILLALLNKYIHWGIYYGTGNKEFRGTDTYKLADMVSRWIKIDICIDLFTCGAFLYATWLMSKAFAAC